MSWKSPHSDSWENVLVKEEWLHTASRNTIDRAASYGHFVQPYHHEDSVVFWSKWISAVRQLNGSNSSVCPVLGRMSRICPLCLTSVNSKDWGFTKNMVCPLRSPLAGVFVRTPEHHHRQCAFRPVLCQFSQCPCSRPLRFVGPRLRRALHHVKSTSPLQKNGYENCTYTATTST